MLNLQLLCKLFDFIVQTFFNSRILTLHALKFAFNFSLFILPLKFRVSFGLVYRFLQPDDLVLALLSLFGVFILLLLVLIVDSLDVVVELSIFVLEFVEFTLLIKLSVNIFFEIGEWLIFSHFVHKGLSHGAEVVLMILDQFLVTWHIWIVFELSHKLSGWVSKLFRDL